MTQQILLNDVDIVIFDMDGVILNVFDAINKAATDGIKKYSVITGNPEDILAELAALIEKLQTIPIPKILLNAKELLNVTFIDYSKVTLLKTLEIAVYLYTQFKQYKMKLSDIYEGIDKFIQFLAEKGKKLAILTNNTKTNAQETLDKHNLTQYFSEILGYNEIQKVKPEPDGILQILEMENIKNPKRAIFIGDMITDAQAGKRANVKTICLASGLSKREDLQKQNPDILVNNINELAQIFGLKL